MLLAHTYGSGVKGYYQSNQTLAEVFMVSQHTTERSLCTIREFICVRNGKGYYRTIWLRPHLQIASAKNGARVHQNSRTIVRNTITQINKDTIASPSPLPPKGASATLVYRMQSAACEIENFKERFGRAGKAVKLTPQQFEQRRTLQVAALRATSKNKRHGSKNG